MWCRAERAGVVQASKEETAGGIGVAEERYIAMEI